MSKLRPELTGDGSKYPCMTNGTAYLMIYSSVRNRGQLIHGKLDDRRGEHCAIGSYFDTNPRTSLPVALIDEVAAVNDSVPHMSGRQRKLHVSRWLRWKLKTLGMPGFSR